MATPTPIFPSAVATNADLKVANNLIQTTLRVGVDATNTILFVPSTAGFAANMLVSIDKEIISITAVVTAPNPALLVAPGGRGFDGTTAAAHAAGAKVSILMDAWHHNVLSTEVQAIEAFLGPNGQNIGVGSAVYLVSSQYQFAAQSPGGSLIAGNNTITLAPVPKGVNGTDQNHYLYLSGGTGTPEAVLITGGTAVSGAATGTVIVNCANAHSGAWTISSATAGIQEALNTLPAGGGMVVIPAGSHPTFAPITVSGSRVTLSGVGASSVITCTGGTFDCIVNAGGVYNSIHSLSITGSGKTDGWAIHCMNGGKLNYEGITIQSMPNGIWLNLITIAFLNEITINDTPGGYGILVFGGNEHMIQNVVHDSSPTAHAFAGICLNATGGTFLSHISIIHADAGLLVNPPNGANVTAVVIDSSYFDTGGIGIEIAPAGVGSGGSPAVTDFRATDCWTSSNSQEGIYITGIVQGVLFQGHLSFGNGKEGILLSQVSGDVSVMNSTIAANSRSSAGGFNNITVAPGTGTFRIQNNTIGGSFFTVTDQAAYAIQMSGTSSEFYLAGNRVIAGSSGTINDTSTGVDKFIGGNSGASNAVPTIASATMIAIPANHPDVILLTGTTAIATITGGYQGARITFIKTDPGSISFTGGNIAAPATLSQNGSLNCLYNVNFSMWFCK